MHPIQTVKKAQGGAEYVQPRVLKKNSKSITRAHFWRIAHDSGKLDVCLKIGRYQYTATGEELEITSPKSELTLDDDELQQLASYLQENHEALKEGASQYILVGGKVSPETANQLRAFFNKPEKDLILSIIVENDILPSHLLHSLRHQERLKAVAEFEELLGKDTTEGQWQKWFQKNSWVLGSDIVRVLDDRTIDTQKVSDFLVEAYDGFLDIIEIKKPDTNQKFWAAQPYRGNLIPSIELVGTIMQATNYIYAVEQESNSIKFLERVDFVKVVKPRGVLIFGRSHDWTEDQRRAFRLLNASYHNLTIMTYDHVLARARRILNVGAEEMLDDNFTAEAEIDEEIPF